MYMTIPKTAIYVVLTMFLHYLYFFVKTEGVKDKRDRQIKTSIEQPLLRLWHRFLYP